MIDIISVIPFDMILMTTSSFNRVARFARIGKLYKIIKLTRMVRVLKIVQIKNKFVKNLTEKLQISIGYERLIFLGLCFFVLEHVVACIW
jgi:hypothetical protein